MDRQIDPFASHRHLPRSHPRPHLVPRLLPIPPATRVSTETVSHESRGGRSARDETRLETAEFMRLRCKPGGNGRISWECCTAITERPLWGEGGEIFPALRRTLHRCSLIPPLAVFISSFFEFLHLSGYVGEGVAGWGVGWEGHGA